MGGDRGVMEVIKHPAGVPMTSVNRSQKHVIAGREALVVVEDKGGVAWVVQLRHSLVGVEELFSHQRFTGTHIS